MERAGPSPPALGQAGLLTILSRVVLYIGLRQEEVLVSLTTRPASTFVQVIQGWGWSSFSQKSLLGL